MFDAFTPNESARTRKLLSGNSPLDSAAFTLAARIRSNCKTLAVTKRESASYWRLRRAVRDMADVLKLIRCAQDETRIVAAGCH